MELLECVNREIDRLYTRLLSVDVEGDEWMRAAVQRAGLLQMRLNLSPEARDSVMCDPDSVVCVF